MLEPGTLVRFNSTALQLLLDNRYSVPYAEKLNGEWVYKCGKGFTAGEGQIGVVVAKTMHGIGEGGVVVLFDDKLVLPFASELEEVKENAPTNK